MSSHTGGLVCWFRRLGREREESGNATGRLHAVRSPWALPLPLGWTIVSSPPPPSSPSCFLVTLIRISPPLCWEQRRRGSLSLPARRKKALRVPSHPSFSYSLRRCGAVLGSVPLVVNLAQCSAVGGADGKRGRITSSSGRSQKVPNEHTDGGSEIKGSGWWWMRSPIPFLNLPSTDKEE